LTHKYGFFYELKLAKASTLLLAVVVCETAHMVFLFAMVLIPKARQLIVWWNFYALLVSI